MTYASLWFPGLSYENITFFATYAYFNIVSYVAH